MRPAPITAASRQHLYATSKQSGIHTTDLMVHGSQNEGDPTMRKSGYQTHHFHTSATIRPGPTFRTPFFNPWLRIR